MTRTLATFLHTEVQETLESYLKKPPLILQDARTEAQLLSGGYGHRQLYELVQNGADAIQSHGGQGRVSVILTEDSLYCANEGTPFTERGVRALLMANMSDKQGDEIGRFGLGFKSVLGICQHPEVFSDSINFRFNPPALAKQLRALVGPEGPLPCLRTAELLDLNEERALDPVLGELKAWASTVIRLHLLEGVRERLAQEIKDFPSAFLVFSPHVASLEFQVEEKKNIVRSLTVKQRGETLIIREGKKRQGWKVFSERIRVEELSEDAQADMDMDLKRRDSLPLVWAAPIGSIPRERSKFWAFFPTQDETTLKGILNAPWKTNSDRENLKDGAFNTYMLTRAASLVARSVGKLNTSDDPARFLDVLPAKENTGELDRILGQQVFNAMREMPCMPNVQGGVDLPSELYLRPIEDWFSDLDAWFERFGGLEPKTWVHRKVEIGDRRSRAKRLESEEVNLSEWLSSILEPENLEVSVAAIYLSEKVLSSEKSTRRIERVFNDLKMVYTSAGYLVAPNPSTLSFADNAEGQESSSTVHPELANDPELRKILEQRFHIQGADAEFAFKSFLVQSDSLSFDNTYWDEFWSLTRTLGPDTVQKLLKSEKPHLRVKVRSLGGTFRDLQQLLEPGWIIIETDDDATRAVTLDVDYHLTDKNLLNALGLRSDPFSFEKFSSNTWLEYENAAVTAFQMKCAEGGYPKPHATNIGIERPWSEGRLDVLRSLSSLNAARFTRRLASYMEPEQEYDEDGEPIEDGYELEPEYTIQLKHNTLENKYPSVEFDALYTWIIKKYGWVETSLGPMPVKNALGKNLSGWSDFFPVFDPDLTEPERYIKVQTDIGSLSDDQWRKALERAESYEGSRSKLSGFYALMATNWNCYPKLLRCISGSEWTTFPRTEIYITCSPEEARILEHEGKPYLRAARARDVALLIEKWHLKPAASGEVGFIPADDPVLMLSKFPGLADESPGAVEKVQLQPCRDLWVEIRSPKNGIERIPTNTAFHSDCFHFMGVPTAGELLRALCSALNMTLSKETFDRIVKESESAAIESRREVIRQVNDLENKLVHAIGGDGLRSGIPSRHLRWLESVKGTPSDIEIAQLAHTVHGVEVLKAYKDALAANGLQPPSQWSGGAKAVSFVQDLGFLDEYAGFAGQGREPWENRQGPTSLNPLHPFQEPVRDRLLEMYRQPESRRAMLTLPTGAGKTRVSVQSMIEWVIELERPCSFLWIAQSDELCEQAVQCWLEAWHAVGPDDQWMRVNRLWGSTNDRICAPEEGNSVVVATYQSLMNRLDAEKFAWIFEPDLVVIDEAHGSTGKSYTSILKRLGLYRKQTERPLLGLTATPFRGGESGDETYRLANRFEYKRISTEFEDSARLYAHLQEQQILAYADHETLPGENILLSKAEMDSLETYHVLPDSAQQRLGRIQARNQRILDHIRKCPPDWPKLVFSVTKDHAEDLAVQLDMTGISARAISSDTPNGRRRRDIEAFKRGEIRVLTNYGVLNTGFDAPKIRAVYVTRPVYTVGLYQQMIGRGLRGPKNGGKERCLIINVEDNVEQYGHRLAFERFEHLWEKI